MRCLGLLLPLPLLLPLGCGDDDRHRPDDAGAGMDGGGMDGGPTDTDAGGEDSGPRRDAGPLGETGDPCEDHGRCLSSMCIPIAPDRSVCTESCTTPADCPAGWGCDLALGVRDEVCVCDPGPERCNREDDDCDGVVDEGSGLDVGCAIGERCTDGTCGCPADRMCGARCVDIDTDPAHCGDCSTACATGDLCAAGRCCAPSTEVCDGDDDDCDGAIDEGTAVALGCTEAGYLCVAGECTCPPERMCGARCVDITSDPDHCGGCGAACLAGSACRDGSCCDVRGISLDLLLQVDNSNSMSEEQASLAEQLPRIVRAFATGDVDGDGTPEFPPVADVHLGVITPDLGTGGFVVPTCEPHALGDDGILRTQGNTAIAGCMATYPTFLTFDPDSPTMDPDTFASEARCLAVAGTGGCGFEQQLDAALKALTPSTSPISFVSGTTGHADGANAGFLRPDSMLVVVLLTDENDCSAQDPEIFNPSTAVYPGDLNMRCFTYPSALHPIRRYVDGLLALRSDPRRLLFGVIAGVPEDLAGASTVPDFEAILADPRMTERVDPESPTPRLIPSCNVPGRGIAMPPRRMVETARDLEALGVATIVHSICRDYDPAVTALLTRLAERLAAACRPE